MEADFGVAGLFAGTVYSITSKSSDVSAAGVGGFAATGNAADSARWVAPQTGHFTIRPVN